MKPYLATYAVLCCLPALLRADPPPENLSAAERGIPALFDRSQLWPDFDGGRARLADRGVTFSLFYTAEVFGNATGGRSQGAVYDGLVEPSIDIDFGKLTG